MRPAPFGRCENAGGGCEIPDLGSPQPSAGGLAVLGGLLPGLSPNPPCTHPAWDRERPRRANGETASPGRPYGPDPARPPAPPTLHIQIFKAASRRGGPRRRLPTGFPLSRLASFSIPDSRGPARVPREVVTGGRPGRGSSVCPLAAPTGLPSPHGARSGGGPAGPTRADLPLSSPLHLASRFPGFVSPLENSAWG